MPLAEEVIENKDKVTIGIQVGNEAKKSGEDPITENKAIMKNAEQEKSVKEEEEEIFY